MIGVFVKAGQEKVAEEFFELFKTPWEFGQPGQTYDVVIVTSGEAPEVRSKVLFSFGTSPQRLDSQLGIVPGRKLATADLRAGGDSIPIYAGLLTFSPESNGVRCLTAGSEIAGILTVADACPEVIRLGYDLFEEIAFLLSSGQPLEYAHIPTLDLHIAILREYILRSGIAILEIPPTPAGKEFAVCLTHDIDFVGIRRHRFDHSMWGFVMRATVGGLRNFARRRLSLGNLLRGWLAVASLPLVYAGWVRDFWEPFEWYLRVEEGLPVTYFIIPFKRRAGEKVAGAHASRRATAYDVGDLRQEIPVLQKHGAEIGVHGIDSWHSAEQGRAEVAAIANAATQPAIGIRMHWLLRDQKTPQVLEQAGYAYDSTVGYNDTVGYRAGTSQVFRPLGTKKLLELPLHIQDGALFYPQRLDLTEPAAESRCGSLTKNAARYGGVLTVLWHDRSHGPERFWGGFYARLVAGLKSRGAWFGTGGEVVGWFRQRRTVRFERLEAIGGSSVRICHDGSEIHPPLRVQVHKPKGSTLDFEAGSPVVSDCVEVAWSGGSLDELNSRLTTQLLPSDCDTASCSHP